MSKPVIEVENLGKRYRIGAKEKIFNTRRERLVHTLTSPFRNLANLRNLTRFEDDNSEDIIWALRNVSFSVDQGEVIGIIGKNGAGKSTLLKILSRIVAPTEGQASIRGRVGSLLEVGTGFHPEMTGRENIYMSGTLLGMRKREIDKKFDEIVAFSEIEKFIDTPAKRYSSGMYVRLAFAVAAHLEPEILIIDEVLSVGDIAFQKKCMGKMGEVAKGGRTVLYVSHNMGSVRKLCEKSVLLEEGIIRKIGDTEEVITSYVRNDDDLSNAVVALPPSQNEAPGQGIKLKILDVLGNERTVFRVGENWKIVVEFELFKETKHIIVAIGLTTIESIPLVTYWSKPQDLSPGNYCVEFICSLPLSANTLNVIVGISSYENTFYFQPDVATIYISEVAQGDQPFRSKGCGLLLSETRPDIWVIR